VVDEEGFLLEGVGGVVAFFFFGGLRWLLLLLLVLVEVVVLVVLVFREVGRGGRFRGGWRGGGGS
jgi:hypothetical protein